MKDNFVSLQSVTLLIVFFTGLFQAQRGNADPAGIQQPLITAIGRDGTNIVINVQVPAGARRVTLESRERLGAGTWTPRAVARVSGAATELTFRIDASSSLELMRVRADATEPLPTFFYNGPTSFVNQASTDVRSDSPSPPIAGQTAPTQTSSSDTRAVVESDIWKIRGNTLYFFNQLRGLQIIDVADPDAPTITGSLSLPAAGEQMYALGEHHVVLLARQGCFYGSADASQVLVVADDQGKPRLVSRLPLSGFVQESRMVGTALYVASQSFRPVAGTTNSMWEWGTELASFDLSDPEVPVKRSTLWFSGYGNVVSATDTYFFAAVQDVSNWWQSIVHIVDISAPDGTMRNYSSVATSGRILDKFKLNYSGAVFTTISEDWHWDGGRRLVTKLETFHLPDPRSLGPIGVFKLGELELGSGERLRATRFDGNLVYVVTFFQIDPLWVVDLSNPSTPHIAGELQVPGWSTYIEPLGDRIVTLGVETNRVTVSLFDVHDPGHPGLLSKVRLGQNFSWSEANYNEKAFSVFPDAGLILVPFSGDTTNGYSSQVQLIDYAPDHLAARGQIAQRFQPRRATVFSDRILSISEWELLTVDATDRDDPLVTSDLELAWPVDRVFIAGEFLIEVAANPGWDIDSSINLRVARTADPDRTLQRMTLADLPVAGATVHGGRLYIAQGQSPIFLPWVIPLAGPDAAVDGGPFVLSIFDLDQLPQLLLLGQIKTNSSTIGWNSDLQALWPRPNLLVWAGSAPMFYPYLLASGPVGGGAVTDAIRPWYPYWGGSGGQFIAFDVADPAAPALVSEISLGQSNWWWATFSKAFAADGLIFVSHSASEFLVDAIPTAPTAIGAPIGGIAAGTGDVFPPQPIGTWVQRSLLDVIDYADPRNPTVRKPVCIPGTLSGIAYDGALLYTVGTHWSTNPAIAWNDYLDASAYDGVAAHLVDSLSLSNLWPHPVLVAGTNVFVGSPQYASSGGYASSFLETWTVSPAGKFTRLGQGQLNSAASLLVSFGDALAVQEADNSLDLFDASDAAALKSSAHGSIPGCLWPDLNHADATLTDGLWTPLGAYGLWHLPVGQ